MVPREGPQPNTNVEAELAEIRIFDETHVKFHRCHRAYGRIQATVVKISRC